MYYPQLEHPNRCKHCLSCAATCPAGAIEYRGDVFSIDIQKCLEKGECLICIQTCPTGALVPRRLGKTKKEKAD